MDTHQSVGHLSNADVLTLFGTAREPADRGFDEVTQARVWAYEFVHSRARLAHYRTLYAAFIEGGMRYMIENLDEDQAERATPAKLVFSDAPTDLDGLEDNPAVIVWTEAKLLAELTRERAVLDFFAGVLDEFRVLIRP